MNTLRIGHTDLELAEQLGQKLCLIQSWKRRIARGEFFRPHCCRDFLDRWELGEDDLWKEKEGEKGFSNRALAEKLGCNYQTVTGWSSRVRKGERFRPYSCRDFLDHWQLRSDNLWEEKRGDEEKFIA